MNLLDVHDSKLPLHVKKFGRPVILTEPDGETTHTGLFAIWNDVEHALKIDGLAGDPMAPKSSLYFDRNSLVVKGITPTAKWTATGSPNKYDPDKDYLLEIPKLDKQLPGVLFFLSKIPGTDTGWKKVADL